MSITNIFIDFTYECVQSKVFIREFAILVTRDEFYNSKIYHFLLPHEKRRRYDYSLKPYKTLKYILQAIKLKKNPKRLYFKDMETYTVFFQVAKTFKVFTKNHGLDCLFFYNEVGRSTVFCSEHEEAKDTKCPLNVTHRLEFHVWITKYRKNKNKKK